jgi:hypothetical protein
MVKVRHCRGAWACCTARERSTAGVDGSVADVLSTAPARARACGRVGASVQLICSLLSRMSRLALTNLFRQHVVPKATLCCVCVFFQAKRAHFIHIVQQGNIVYYCTSLKTELGRTTVLPESEQNLARLCATLLTSLEQCWNLIMAIRWEIWKRSAGIAVYIYTP